MSLGLAVAVVLVVTETRVRPPAPSASSIGHDRHHTVERQPHSDPATPATTPSTLPVALTGTPPPSTTPVTTSTTTTSTTTTVAPPTSTTTTTTTTLAAPRPTTTDDRTVWTDALSYPDDIATTFPFSALAGPVSASVHFGAGTLELVLRCGRASSTVQGSSPLSTSLPSASGQCAVSLAEPFGASATVRFRLAVEHLAAPPS